MTLAQDVDGRARKVAKIDIAASNGLGGSRYERRAETREQESYVALSVSSVLLRLPVDTLTIDSHPQLLPTSSAHVKTTDPLPRSPTRLLVPSHTQHHGPHLPHIPLSHVSRPPCVVIEAMVRVGLSPPLGSPLGSLPLGHALGCAAAIPPEPFIRDPRCPRLGPHPMGTVILVLPHVPAQKERKGGGGGGGGGG